MNVTTFESVFSSCTGIQRVPDGLFDTCVKANFFDTAFKSCSALKWAPELWILYNDPNGTNGAITKHNCFVGCSAAENYSQIPEKWKSW